MSRGQRSTPDEEEEGTSRLYTGSEKMMIRVLIVGSVLLTLFCINRIWMRKDTHDSGIHTAPPPPSTPSPTASSTLSPPTSTPSRPNEIYVDPLRGNDTGDGSIVRPYKSLSEVPNETSQVVLMTGVHTLKAQGPRRLTLRILPGADVTIEYIDELSVMPTPEPTESTLAPTPVPTPSPPSGPTPPPLPVLNVTIPLCKECKWIWEANDCFSQSTVLSELECRLETPNPIIAPFCLREDNCFAYKTGRYTEAEREPDPPKSSLPQCSRLDIEQMLDKVTYHDNGDFVRHRTPVGWNVKSSICSLKQYGRGEIFKLWEGKRILITGNSIARQMFIKLTHLLRGTQWETNLDFGGTGGLYFASNTSHDVLLQGKPKRGEHPVLNELIEIEFSFVSNPTTYSVLSASRGEVDVHIAVMSWENSYNVEMFNTYMDGAVEYAKSRPDFQYVFIPGSLKKSQSSSQVAQASMEQLAEKLQLSNTISLSMAAYSKLRYFDPLSPRLYMCNRKQTNPKKSGKRCRDYFNTNWWKLLFNVLDNLNGPNHIKEKLCVTKKTETFVFQSCAAPQTIVPKSGCSENGPLVFRKYCKNPGRCFAPGKGKFIDSTVQDCTPATKLPRCTFSGIKKDLEAITRKDNGVFSYRKTEKGQQVISESCNLLEYSRADLMRVFRGKKLLFSGDSLTRQMFKKFVHIARDGYWDHSFEYKGHIKFYYAMGEKEDVFLVNKIPKKGVYLVENQIFEVQFIWDPLPTSFKTKSFTTRGVVDFHIGSVGVWWQDGQPSNFINSYMKGAMRFAADHPKNFTYVFLPGTVKVRFRFLENPPDETRVAKLEKLTKLINQPNAHTLSMTRYSMLQYFPATDGTHYMCGASTFYPGTPGSKTVTDMAIQTKNGHLCYDYYGANLWIILMNAFDSLLTRDGH
eukprot:TRINITY_DN33758_c0_g1_i1.p1 TRINITY_DN33758_c0_g1~~TRINITY_DN33758_c0_g1_i1.p1  ORF type:complete len:913 (+),score=91.89 TRINITY_DN33758_c0_g1_i1:76-2814(+)